MPPNKRFLRRCCAATGSSWCRPCHRDRGRLDLDPARRRRWMTRRDGHAAAADGRHVEPCHERHAMVMTPAVWTPGYAALIFSMWWIMMVAMMLPSATPMLLLFARVNRKEKSRRTALCADGDLCGRLSGGLGRVQCHCRRPAVGAGGARPAFVHDGEHERLARRRDPDRRRAWQLRRSSMPACAIAARRSASLPAAGGPESSARSAWDLSMAPIAWDAAGS